MDYPKNFDPYIDSKILMKALDCSLKTAQNNILKANKNLKENGYQTFKGKCPVSEILKIIKCNRETLIYFWEEGQRKKVALDERLR